MISADLRMNGFGAGRGISLLILSSLEQCCLFGYCFGLKFGVGVTEVVEFVFPPDFVGEGLFFVALPLVCIPLHAFAEVGCDPVVGFVDCAGVNFRVLV